MAGSSVGVMNKPVTWSRARSLVLFLVCAAFLVPAPAAWASASYDIRPDHGPPGSSFKVTGSGYAPNEKTTVTVPPNAEPGNYPVSADSVNRNQGAFELRFFTDAPSGPCPSGQERDPSGYCYPECPIGQHRSPSGYCTYQL